MTDTGVDTTGTDTTGQRDGRAKAGFFSRLYTGTGAFDVVGRRKLWYLLFGALVLVCVGSIVFRGFNLGIDFTGGTQIQFPAAGAGAPATVEDVRGVYEQAVGQEPAAVQTVGQGDRASVLIRSEPLDAAQTVALKQALFDRFQPHRQRRHALAWRRSAITAVSGTWGGQITRQALIALAVFLVLVTIFLAFYFERAMAVAALVALVHDVVVTMGVYSIVGFEVTPATAIGLLTILGFSLYDTVVVFDKVKENTRGLLGLTRRTYAEAANLALNQTLMRSINTSLIAVLPVVGPHGRRRRAARGRHAGRPGAGADRRHPRRRGVVGAAGDADPGRPQAARPAHPRAGAAGRRPPGPGGCGRGRRRPAGPIRRRPRPERRRRAGGRAAARARHGRRGRRPLPDGTGPAPGREPRTPTGKFPAHREAAPVTDGAAVVDDDDPLARVGRAGPRRPRLPRARRGVPRHHPGAGRRRGVHGRRRSRSRRWSARPTSWSGSRRGGSCSVRPRR